MLTKQMRKKLQEHDWLEIARRDSNPHQTLLRLKSQARRTMDDLALLARKLPENKQRGIFNYANIENLVNSIFRVNLNDEHLGPFRPYDDSRDFRWDMSIEPELDARRCELAALLVRRGTDFCIKQYQWELEKNYILNEPIISQLKKSQDICRGISNEVALKGGSGLIG